MQDHLSDEPSFLKGHLGPGSAWRQVPVSSRDHAADINGGPVGRLELNNQAAAAVLGLIGVDDLHSQRRFKRDAADVPVSGPVRVHRPGSGFTSLGRGHQPALDDRHLRLAGLVDQHHGFTRHGMTGKGVLRIDVANVEPIAGLDHEVDLLARLVPGEDLLGEDSGVRLGLGRGELDRFPVVENHVEGDLVLLFGRITIVIHDLDDDLVPRVDPHQPLANFIDTVAGSHEIVGDRSDRAVVVGGRQLAGQQPAGGVVSLGQFVGVGGGDHVTSGDLERRVVRQGQHVGLGRNVLLVGLLTGHLDIADRHRHAAVLENVEADIAKLMRFKLHAPFAVTEIGPHVFSLECRASELLVEIKVQLAERQHHDAGTVVVGASDGRLHAGGSGGGGREDGQPVRALFKPDIDGAISGSHRQLESTVDGDGSPLAGHRNPGGALAFLHQQPRPDRAERPCLGLLVLGILGTRPLQLVDRRRLEGLRVATQADDLAPVREAGVISVVEPESHLIMVQGSGVRLSLFLLLGLLGCIAGRDCGLRTREHLDGSRLGRVAGQAEPETSIVAAVEHAPNGNLILGIRRRQPNPRDEFQVLHVDGQLLGGRPIGFALPESLGIAIDRHQRAVLDGGVAGLGPGRQFAGGGGALENTRVRRGFLELDLDLVTALGSQLDHDLVELVAEVPVLVLDPQVDRVAGLDLAGRPLLGDSQVGLFPLTSFPFQPLAESLLFRIDDPAARNGKLTVGGDDDVDIRQRHPLELLLELVGIIAADFVFAGDLQFAVTLLHRTQFGRQVHSEQPLTSSPTDQEHPFDVTTGLGGHDHRDPVVTTADAQVAVLDDDRERQAGRVCSLAVAAQSTNGPQQVQLIDVTFLIPVNLRKAVEGLVGQRDRGNPIEHTSEDGSGFVTVATTV